MTKTNTLLTALFLIAVAQSTGRVLEAADSGAPDQAIRIRIEDYAEVSARVRAEALEVAEGILGEAGVDLLWLDCSPFASAPRDARCDARPEPVDIFLRLMPEEMAAKTGLQADCLDFAIVPARKFGLIAAVFWDMAEKTAEKWCIRRSTVLGHAIAHEIGHLLIAQSGHARKGLMKANWGRSEILHANKAPMKFTIRDKERIRLNVRARLAGL